jgi:exodeoxyribonuclease V gamma subunit
MPSFKLYTGNKTELLLDALAEVVKVPHESPFYPEIIIVQNMAMERWISLEFARKFGIWANCSYFLPNSFVEFIFKKTFSQIPGFSGSDPKILSWKIMSILPNLIDHKEFGKIKRYLRHPRRLTLFQLSYQIADTFDHYTIFRPDVVLQWEKGDEEHWQAILWRELAKMDDDFKHHRARLREQLLLRIRDRSFSLPFPSNRISAFGISALPPFFIEIFNALSTITDMHVFTFNPCNEFWDDVLSEREIHRIGVKKGRKMKWKEEQHWDTGNFLLSTMGGYGRDFLSLVHNCDGEEFSLVSEPDQNTLLSNVQSDILHLRRRGKNELNQPIRIESDDHSIQLHSSHGPMREIEILFDSILHQFDSIKGLTPSDIVVMAPEIQLYAPYIHAVFGNASHRDLAIPYTVSRDGNALNSRIVSTFLSIISLTGGRFTITEVLALLESPSIQKKFTISALDADQIRFWMSDLHVNWGLDGKSRAGFGLSESPENTWESGIEQLILGYAMLGDSGMLCLNRAPYGAIEGDKAQILGRFLDFYTAVAHAVQSCAAPHSPIEWVSVLYGIVDAFFPDDEDHSFGIKTLRDAIQALPQSGDTRLAPESIDFETMAYFLRKLLTDSNSMAPPLTGGITFCDMLPMRGIPFRVVCLIGMDEAVFPRKSPRLSWDIASASPRKGDRSRENEDRYIFLEALFSARDVFYLSYDGQEIRDNSIRQPSVVISEFLDHIDKGFYLASDTSDCAAAENGIRQSIRTPPSSHLTFQHRLQAFHRDYFSPDGRLFSFSAENFQASRRLGNPAEDPHFFFRNPLPPPSDNWKKIDINDLCVFFGNPVKYLLKNRLGISLDFATITLQDNEPFAIEGLSGYTIGQKLVETFLLRGNREECYAFLKAKGLLPHGNAGKTAFDMLADEAEEFAGELLSIGGGALENCTVNGEVGPFSLSGTISGISRSGLVHYRFAAVRPKDRFALWLQSLALAALRPEVRLGKSVILGRNAFAQLPQIENARTQLAGVLDYYWKGMSWPLHFFPNASWTFAENYFRGKKSDREATSRARKVWDGDEFQQGEKADPYYSLVWGNEALSPIDDEFMLTSRDLLESFCNLMSESPL